MAREVAAPIAPPPLSIETWREDEERYIKTLRAAAIAAHDGDYVGEILRWQRADGYAVYMIWRQRPLELIHVAIGDGYSVEPSLIRGLTFTEAVSMVNMERSWRRAFSEPNETFYTKDRIGQIVHYSNGFGQFVRCEVVAAETVNNLRQEPAIGGVALRPIALVGGIRGEGNRTGWFEWDLYRRLYDGTVAHGYHAQRVLSGELMQPNASNIYEFSERLQQQGPDPRGMEPLSLDPPPLTAEQEEAARLVRVLNQIDQRIEDVDKQDPETLREVMGIIAALAMNAVSE